MVNGYLEQFVVFAGKLYVWQYWTCILLLGIIGLVFLCRGLDWVLSPKSG